jgi:hypothetical protein
MENQNEENLRPECSYCNDSSGECEHVLLDYDASFMEILSGYLANDSEEMEQLKSQILDLVQSSNVPVLGRGHVKDIWDYAVNNYVPNSREISFDETAYFNLLDKIIDSFGGESFHYNDDDGVPGFSSSYIIYFAEDPKETIRQINSFIIQQLKS